MINLWDKIKIEEISSIEKLVGEYNIWELKKTPYAKFKIKIYMSKDYMYKGYTNLQVRDQNGDYYSAVGYGKTEEEALDDTIQQFLKMLERKCEWNETDFCCVEPFDF